MRAAPAPGAAAPAAARGGAQFAHESHFLGGRLLAAAELLEYRLDLAAGDAVREGDGATLELDCVFRGVLRVRAAVGGCRQRCA